MHANSNGISTPDEKARTVALDDRTVVPTHFVPARRHRAVSISADARFASLLGVGSCDRQSGGDENDRPSPLLEHRLSIALDRISLLEREVARLREASERDPLTGLLNRTAMETLIAVAIPAGCAVAFVDIDRFKSINDSLGHAAGDRILRAFANALKEALGDHPLARWGGEEFMVLLRDVDMPEAAAIMEAARKRIAATVTWDVPGGSLPTFSTGVAVSNGCGMNALIHAADRCLYLAKNNGRDRVVAANHGEHRSPFAGLEHSASEPSVSLVA